VSGLRGLSIRQPWAFAIAKAGKTVENRSRGTAFRGLLAIHASQIYDEEAALPTPAALSLLMDAAIAELRGTPDPALTRGAVVAVATLDECHWYADCRSFEGTSERLCTEWAMTLQWHWSLADVRPLAEPVPCRGQLGLWTVPEDAERAIRAQLEAS